MLVTEVETFNYCNHRHAAALMKIVVVEAFTCFKAVKKQGVEGHSILMSLAIAPPNP